MSWAYEYSGNMQLREIKCTNRHSTGDVGSDLLVGGTTTNSCTEERLKIQRSNKGGFNIYNNFRYSTERDILTVGSGATSSSSSLV